MLAFRGSLVNNTVKCHTVFPLVIDRFCTKLELKKKNCIANANPIELADKLAITPIKPFMLLLQ